MTAHIGIVTVSDRASQGVYQDLGGPAIRACLDEILTCPWEPVARLIPDEQPVIEAALRELCDQEKCCLVVTTGGTGPARRDVTPEATAAVCDKILDGFAEQMRRRLSQSRADGNPLPTSRRHSRRVADRQSAWQTQRHPRLPVGGLSGDTVLHRFVRGAVSDDG